MSVEFLRSTQNVSHSHVEGYRQNMKKLDICQRKNFDRLGVFMSKFSNLISEHQRQLKTQYQEKIKEKTTKHHQSLYLLK